MCDTFIASSSVTKNKKSVFAKNSDRPPNEAQQLVHIPKIKHVAGEEVECTYIRIPQVRETLAVLLSQPFWMWGAEMGINEAGLAIGNEAVYSKIPANKEPALLGMDLLRLALERATNPRDAVEVIVELLERYGQGGNCVQQGEMYYHNSFLLADAQDAWVLETIDRDWVARQVEETYSISNILTISNKWDSASSRFEDYLQHPGTSNNLSRDYSDFLYTTFSNARYRCNKTQDQLNNHLGQIDVETVAAILRDKEDHPDPGKGFTKANVCMHAGFGPIRISQTTASLIAVLDGEQTLVFATGSSAPCTGIFKPLWVDIPLPEMGPAPTETFDPGTLFWPHEKLHRAVERQYDERLNAFVADRDSLEQEFIHGAIERKNASTEERAEFSKKCFERAAHAENEWLQRVLSVPEKRNLAKLFHNLAWNRWNREAKLD